MTVYNLNYTPTTLGYKIEDKLYLGVREQKKLIITGLGNNDLHGVWTLSGQPKSCCLNDIRNVTLRVRPLFCMEERNSKSKFADK
jgi:hypothetical protein